ALSVTERQLHGSPLNIRRVVSRICGALFRGSFRDTAREDRLEETLEKSKTLLGSLAGAIPGFGSFAQELIEFLLKELKRRLFGRR
ncbi:hypothetical protein, partial [Xanthomonas arboricola]|uniref:hypothetical protein n=2 Tax=Xanthomonas TaxID=338 RepID=UPI001C85DC79